MSQAPGRRCLNLRSIALRNHWDADEIHRQHPHLSLGQIYAALAYYFDHKEDLDAQIEDQLKSVEAARASAGQSLVRAKLKMKSKLD